MLQVAQQGDRNRRNPNLTGVDHPNGAGHSLEPRTGIVTAANG